jgi:hypothetical protein
MIDFNSYLLFIDHIKHNEAIPNEAIICSVSRYIDLKKEYIEYIIEMDSKDDDDSLNTNISSSLSEKVYEALRNIGSKKSEILHTYNDDERIWRVNSDMGSMMSFLEKHQIGYTYTHYYNTFENFIDELHYVPKYIYRIKQ